MQSEKGHISHQHPVGSKGSSSHWTAGAPVAKENTKKLFSNVTEAHIFSSLNFNTSRAPKRELVSVLAGLRQLNVEKIRFLDN